MNNFLKELKSLDIANLFTIKYLGFYKGKKLTKRQHRIAKKIYKSKFKK